jgi:histidinol-phosphate aminotransferase
MGPLPELPRRHPHTRILVDEAFIGMAGESVASWVPRFPNLLVTRTLSKALSLAGFRVGYGVFPHDVADDLNGHNDACPLVRARQAAALATLRHEQRIRERAQQLPGWTEELAAQLRGLGVQTFPTQRHFFLSDFAPGNVAAIAESPARRQILVEPMVDPALGPAYMRLTTTRP